MKIKGKLAGITKDYISGHYHITVEMLEGNISETDSLRDIDLSVELKSTGKAGALMQTHSCGSAFPR